MKRYQMRDVGGLCLGGGDCKDPHTTLSFSQIISSDQPQIAATICPIILHCGPSITHEMSGRKPEYLKSMSASRKAHINANTKTCSSGSWTGFESIFTYAECECSGGPDKARPHFFHSDISTFRSLQGKGYQQILLLHRMMTVYLSFKNLLIPDNIQSSL